MRRAHPPWRSDAGPRDLVAVAAAGGHDRVVVVVPGREAGGLEEHHHERDVLGLAGVRVALHALLRGLLDAVDLGEQPRAGAGEVVPAAGVEVQRGAGEVGVAVVEAAGGAGGARVGVDRLQRRRDGGLLGDRRGRGPRLVGDAGAGLGAVVVLDGAAHPGLADELDQADALERAHVVGDRPQGRAEPAGELDRAGGPLVQQRDDPDAQRVAHRLDVARVVDARDRFVSRRGADRRLAVIPGSGQRCHGSGGKRLHLSHFTESALGKPEMSRDLGFGADGVFDGASRAGRRPWTAADRPRPRRARPARLPQPRPRRGPGGGPIGRGAARPRL